MQQIRTSFAAIFGETALNPRHRAVGKDPAETAWRLDRRRTVRDVIDSISRILFAFDVGQTRATLVDKTMARLVQS